MSSTSLLSHSAGPRSALSTSTRATTPASLSASRSRLVPSTVTPRHHRTTAPVHAPARTPAKAPTARLPPPSIPTKHTHASPASLGLGAPPCRIPPSFVSCLSDVRDASYFINDHLPASEQIDITPHLRFRAGQRYTTPTQETAEARARRLSNMADRSWMAEPTPTKYSYVRPHRPEMYDYAVATSAEEDAHRATGCRGRFSNKKHECVGGEASLARRRTVAEACAFAENTLGAVGETDFGLDPRFAVRPAAVAPVLVAEPATRMERLLSKVNLGKSTRGGSRA